jgi:hypothetical protein
MHTRRETRLPKIWPGTNVDGQNYDGTPTYVQGLLLTVEEQEATLARHDLGEDTPVLTSSLNVVEDSELTDGERQEVMRNRRQTYQRIGARLRRAFVIVHDEKEIPKPGVFIQVSPDDPTQVIAIRIGDEKPSTWDAGLIEIASPARLTNEQTRLEELAARHCH